MKMIGEALQFFLAILVFQHAAAEWPELHIHLLDDVLASSDNKQLLSVECGVNQILHPHMSALKGSGILNAAAGVIQEGQYYLELNGSHIDSYSDLINYTSLVHENGNITVKFSIPKLKWFIGEFTCGYYNFSDSVNVTSNLAFAYIPTYHDNSDDTILVLFIALCSLFLLTLIACIITGVSNLRYRYVQKHQPYLNSHNHTRNYNSPIEKMTSHSPILFSASGYAIPSCTASRHSIPHESFSSVTKPLTTYGKEFVSEEAIDKLIAHLDHSSSCKNVNCPCLFYKQKVRESLFWSTAMRNSSDAASHVVPTTPVMEVGDVQGNWSASPYHVTQTACSYYDQVTSPASNDIERDCAHVPRKLERSSVLTSKPLYSPTRSTLPIKGCDITYPQICVNIDDETSKPSSQFDLDVKFVDPIETVTFDNKGGRYTNENHEVRLEVPEGAIPRGKTISVEVGVSLHSALVPLLPPGKKPVSPLVQFCVVGEENFRFLKPVEIILPHYLDIADVEAVNGMELQFMKSGHNLYCFHQCDGTASFRPGASTATLKTKHFCMFCITARGNISDKNINYRLVKAVPKNCQSETWRASFCVAYYLRTCLQALKKQFPDTEYELKTLRRFKFAESAPLEICFERKLAGGWHLSLENSGKITPEDVMYWNIDPEELEMMEEDKVYPPRFDIQVCGTHARETVNALICFRGMAGGGDSTELLLESAGVMLPFHALHPSVSEPIISHPRHVMNYSPLVTRKRKDILSKPVDQRAPSDSPSHSDLMNFVAAALPTKWQMVGIQLGLTVAKINEIESYHSNDCKRCFSSVFFEWENQNTSPYSWATVINVLRMPCVEENRVAEEITSLFRADHEVISIRSSTSSTLTSGYNTTDNETNV